MPLVLIGAGFVSSLINPEIAAGHPNYVRNWHLLNSLKVLIVLGSMAIVAVLWLLGCFLVIRAKKQSRLWLLLTPLGPFGFAVVSVLNDRAPAETDKYSRFVRSLNMFMRIAYELCSFVVIWEIAYQTMVLKRILMIRYESITTGVPTAQIIATQNASSGMWAFGEGMEVMFLVVLLYLLRPVVFNLVGRIAAPRPLLQEDEIR
jgi:hypothetical protein